MLLYRAQPRTSRHRSTEIGNEPAVRIRGRWFSCDLELTVQAMAAIEGPAEIIVVEVADAIAATFQVSNTPITPCGLEPARYSTSPETDYVLPAFIVSQAELVEMPAEEGQRKIDVIDIRPQQLARAA